MHIPSSTGISILVWVYRKDGNHKNISVVQPLWEANNNKPAYDRRAAKRQKISGTVVITGRREGK
ncbi:MAG: hypothetical protein E3J72_19520 [Planctomycetota bacterium]|nr:MAG: hypothetical protein E3J72_19520 [Planctomycetota bacterium]